MKKAKLFKTILFIAIFVMVFLGLPVGVIYGHTQISLNDSNLVDNGYFCGTTTHWAKFNVQDTENYADYKLETLSYEPPNWGGALYGIKFQTVGGDIFSVAFGPPTGNVSLKSGMYVVYWDTFYPESFRVNENASVDNDQIKWIIAYYEGPIIGCSEAAPAPVWVRTMPMTVWQVWINEDNAFQFIFWYPYKDENWVRIYDMDGNMVFEVDLPVHDPNLIVDLPDGMYTVKTFHGLVPLQEFVIGKP